MSLWQPHFAGLNSRSHDTQDDQGTAASDCPGARRRVVLGLGVLVALIVAGHWMDAGSNDMVWRDAERIHLVERQGIGTERIAKLALQVQAVGPGAARDRLLSEFDQVLVHWDQSYDLLRDGVVDSRATSHSREVESIYCELGTMQWGLVRSGRELVNAIRYPQPGPLDLDPHVANVLRFERDNLDGIERLVVQYRRDTRQRIAQGQIYSRIWLTLFVAALAASGWWVLQSLVKQLDLAGDRLSRSRSELLAARQTLRLLNDLLPNRANTSDAKPVSRKISSHGLRSGRRFHELLEEFQPSERDAYGGARPLLHSRADFSLDT